MLACSTNPPLTCILAQQWVALVETNIMQLVLSVGDKVIDAVPLQRELIGDTEYLAAKRRLLAAKNELTLLAYVQEPTFYIEAVSGVNPE